MIRLTGKLNRLFGFHTLLLALSAVTVHAQAHGPDPVTGIVHSQRLEQGIPLGGIGTGSIQVMTDGAISRVAIHNNWDQPTGDLPGCFAAFWTRSGSQTVARVLGLHSGYGLPTAPALDCDPLFPQAQMEFPDAALPVQVSLRAFSPLIPGDLRNSSFPAAAFVFRLVNRSAVPVDIGVALSWENTLGYGEAEDGTALRNRTGDRVIPIPDSDGYFGLRFQGAPAPGPFTNAARENRGGEMTLMAYPPRREAVVTTAGWNALDPIPAWWDAFQHNGVVSGQAPEGVEGKAVPAGVVAVQMTLKPRDSVEIPLCIAWYNPPLLAANGDDYGRYYQLSFPDSTRAARELLGNWLSLFTLTEEWQKHLSFSNLPIDLIHSLINSASPLVTGTLLTRDGNFTFLPDASGREGPARSGDYLPARLDAATLLLTLYPQLEARELIQMAVAQAREGDLPSDPRDWRRRLGPIPSPAVDETEAGQPLDLQGSRHPLENRDTSEPKRSIPISQQGLESVSAYVLQCAQYVHWTGDLVFLRRMLPGLRSAMSAFLQDTDLKAALRSPSSGQNGLPLYDLTALTHWLAALEAARQMAHLAAAQAFQAAPPSGFLSNVPDALIEVMTERRFLAACDAAYARAAAALAQQDPTHSPMLTLTEKALPLIANAGSLTSAAGWNRLYALEGFGYDAESGRLALSPQIPGAWRMLSAPIFAATFWGWIEFKPTAHGGLVTLRIERTIALTPIHASHHFAGNIGGPTLSVRQLRVPGPPPIKGQKAPPMVTVHVSLGPNPIGCQVSQESSGDLTLTFDTPLSLVAGNFLEVDVH